MSGGRRFDRCATTETRDRRPRSRPSYDHQNTLDRPSWIDHPGAPWRDLPSPAITIRASSSEQLHTGHPLGVHRGVLGGIMAVRNPAR
jgi:hypothetical protein